MSQLREALEKSKFDAEKLSEQLEESQKNLAECEEKYVLNILVVDSLAVR